MADIHNVFISHYSGDVQRLRDLKDRLAACGCTARNSSAEEDKDGGLVRHGHRVSNETIARYLRAGIKWAKTLIVIIGEHTHERPWVNYEIRQAARQGKQIVGIYMHGCKDKVELPEAYKRYGGSPLGWNSLDKLSDIIKGKVVAPEAPNGTSSSPIYNIIHIICK
jgi:hypothetical protein